jgi:hypothetical protein
MRRAISAVIVGTLLIVASTGSVSAAPNPTSCAGYPQPRVYMAGQDWWQPIAGLPDDPYVGKIGHLHMEECFPLYQRVSGTLGLDIFFVEHHNEGVGKDFRIHDDLGKECFRTNVVVPTDSTGNGSLLKHIDLNTTCFADGFRNIVMSWRIVQPNGNRIIVRQEAPVTIDNGKADTNWKTNFTLGGGWYKENDGTTSRDWGYAHGVILGFYPLTPRSGSWTLQVLYGRHPRSSAVREEFGRATIDPDFHHGYGGVVVQNVAGGYKGPLTIDTTRFANGLHRLVLIECTNIPAENKEHCGVQAITFVVAN